MMTDASNWLDLDKVAEVEISSEDVRCPIENALSLDGGPSGWVAAEPGAQTLRLVFYDQCHIKRIRLVFVETYIARTQEYAVSYTHLSSRSKSNICRIPLGNGGSTLANASMSSIELGNFSIVWVAPV